MPAADPTRTADNWHRRCQLSLGADADSDAAYCRRALTSAADTDSGTATGPEL